MIELSSKGIFMKRGIVFLLSVVFFTSCTATQPAKKSDADFAKALEESEKNKNKKLDFLADEKLPNDEFIPVDTAGVSDTAVVMPVEYKEIAPTTFAKYRIQVFAGSAENAYKNYVQLSSNPENKEVYMVQDQDGKWKVWVGAYPTHADAEAAKAKFIQSGYPDAWINEMKGRYAPAGPAFWVQIGSFQNEASAQKAKAEAETRIKEQVSIELVDKTWKVWVGGFAERGQADELKKKVQTFYPKSFIVRHGE
ncbi:SPOR domain-containing protein [bacterium]|nr:SPOR domain-containing protein [bacterium]